MAWMNAEHLAAFHDERVIFKSVNLLSGPNLDKLAELGITFDYCINLAAETKLGKWPCANY